MDKDKKYNLDPKFFLEPNIAELIEENKLDQMGADLKTQVETDISSRSEWLEKNDKWMELVTQVMEAKTYPWPNASNIKFPLISTAAIQFHARAYPALLGNNKPVKLRVIGRDEKSLKAQRAGRLSTFLSYQVTDQIDGWMDDMDRLLFIVPIIGSLYKKTYFSDQKNKIASELVHPRDFIINYDAIEIEDARKTHRLWKLANTIVEYQRKGLYREIPNEEEMPLQPPKVHSKPRDNAHGLNNSGKADHYALQELYEVHCMLDLDDDGYQEPYVVTLRESDGKIYRIAANYGIESIEYNQHGEISAIKPNDYFTHYFFLPDPESKTHGIGFGTMVGPINEAVNTIINQLTDAGHMHTLGGGFLARGIRMKGGAVKFKPNEWKTVQTTGDDLKKGILPLPTKEPSATLFQLLGLLIDSGKDLSSVQDLMVGRNPGQNQPYSTTQAVMEQGMKVFNGIYKRLYRSMTAEFRKIYNLNKDFPDPVSYMEILDLDGQEAQQAAQAPDMATGQAMGMQKVLQFLAEDFRQDNHDVVPTAEPDMVAEMQKIMRANALMDKLKNGLPINVMEVTKRTLEAEGHENVEVLLQVPKQPPPPDVVLDQKKFEHQVQLDGLIQERENLLAKSQINKNEMEAMLAYGKAQNESVEGLHTQFMDQQRQITEEFNAVTNRIKALTGGQKRETGKPTSGDSGDN